MEKGFTLVIPLYNKVFCVRKTLDSVLNNHGTYSFKCIIIDDDSTDGSSEIAEEYDTKYPDVFMYVKKKHKGNKTSVFAKNFALKLVDTEYVGFLDADDELCPGFIDRGCSFLDEHPEYNAYGNGFIYNRINENGEEYSWNCNHITNGSLDFLAAITGNNFGITFCAHIYKTELVKQHPFANTYHEGFVFKFKYIYYNQPIYIDNSTCESIKYNEQNSESYDTWEVQKDNEGLYEKIFKALDDEIPGFEYGLNKTDNGYLVYIR